MGLALPSIRILLRVLLGWSILITVVAGHNVRTRQPDTLAAQAIATRQDDPPGDVPIDEPEDGVDDGDGGEEEEEEIPMNPPPTEDPWYRPPEGWEAAEPGSILKTRPEGLPVCDMKYCAGTFQYLYKSSDTHGDDSWAVATVFYSNITTPPACKDLDDPDDCVQGVVAYAVAYDSASPDACPSYLLQWGDPYGEMVDMLKRGYFVVLIDYEGPSASYCTGPQAAYAILDAIRGVKEIGGEVGINTDTAKYTIWGYSGGAFAAGFAAEMAAEYAPDLDIAGAIVGGTSPNLTTACLNMNGQNTAGLVISGLIGITSQWPEERAFMMDRLHKEGPYNATIFMRAALFPAIYVLHGFSEHNVYNYFENGEDDILEGPIRRLFNTEGQMGIHGIPNMPTFIYKAGVDEMSPIEETDEMVNHFCESGANILYHRNSIGDHNRELWSGRLRALDYIGMVTHGIGEIEIPEEGCLIVNVTIGLPDFNDIELGNKVAGGRNRTPAEGDAGDSKEDPTDESPDAPENLPVVEEPVEDSP